MLSSYKGATAISAAMLSWGVAYYYVANELNRSASIVSQSVFNINMDFDQKEISLPVSLSTNISGNMNQFKGHANISFGVIDKLGNKFNVEVMAHRSGLNWKTEKLTATGTSGSVINFI